MKENKQRRKFLGQLSAGLASMMALPLLGSENSEAPIKKDMKKDKILRIIALGFQWETADPFLFCVHHEDHYPKGNELCGPAASLDGRNIGQDFLLKDGWRMYHGATVPGFPGHPHRGFETITVVRKGLVDHADSMGAAGRYGNGDVQWMTAGKGVQHSEMFPLLKKEEDNPLELFQIWLNLPKRNKMVEPHFKMLWSEEVPRTTHKDANGNTSEIEVLVGKLGDLKAKSAPPNSWAADENNHVAIWNIQLQPNAQWTIPAAIEGINRTLYYYEGEGLSAEGKVIPTYHGAELDASQSLELTAGSTVCKVLILQGRPIGEPVVQHGPFVMNTKQEIYQAFEDYQRTQFGGWPWPKADQVHDRSKGRFARHADGKEEVKG